MDAQNFCYWLQGFSELAVGHTPTPEQWKAIQEHLNLVFKKVTPAIGFPPKSLQEMMQEFQKGFLNQMAINPGIAIC